jgi:hypothetical protein
MGVLNDILNDVEAEVGRLNTQATAELASALFNGSGFVQYGAGQNPVGIQRETEQGVEGPPVQQPAIEEPSRGMEM